MSRSYSRLALAIGMASVLAAAGCKNSSANQTSGEPVAANSAAVNASGTVRVTVSGDGFVPSSIKAKQGQPLTLEFTRVSDQTCAKQVVFPELNINKDLPLNSAVAIRIPTDSARTLTFQCGMGMFKSSLVIL